MNTSVFDDFGSVYHCFGKSCMYVTTFNTIITISTFGRVACGSLLLLLLLHCSAIDCLTTLLLLVHPSSQLLLLLIIFNQLWNIEYNTSGLYRPCTYCRLTIPYHTALYSRCIHWTMVAHTYMPDYD